MSAKAFSAELLAVDRADLDRSPYIVTRRPEAERGAPEVEYTINAQGTILNARFSCAQTATAAGISRFVAEHNARIVALRANSGLADLR
jgi:hypothetical protein